MNTPACRVAVLLATYNGAQYVEAQMKSLTENSTPFTLHWLDDQSTDDTRERVRAFALREGMTLIECHQEERQGVPGAFFQLLEIVDADLYLFCDQDDIWQPGKIDATVANLLPDIGSPALCFSDPLVFSDEDPSRLQRFTEMAGAKTDTAVQETRSFMSVVAVGHTQGLTRPLREIYLRHKDIARTYAFGHDVWLYSVAIASGSARMLRDAPTTLYRRHGQNVSGMFFKRGRKGMRLRAAGWSVQQMLRRALSRQAEGFVLAAPTLPPGPKLDRTLAIAKLVATLARRQSPVELVRLARHRAMFASWRLAASLTAVCLRSNADAADSGSRAS